jgi:hypothetical protein
MTLNAAAYCASTSNVLAGQRWNEQVAGARDTVYGSEGLGVRVPPNAPSSVQVMPWKRGGPTEREHGPQPTA